MSARYPERFDLFEVKRNAQFKGDPNGDWVMAEDVNRLQDAISAIEEVLGLNPQGSKISVGERITLLEGSSVLRVPPILMYFGDPAAINNSATIEDAVSEYIKYDHVVFGSDIEDEANPSHASTQAIIDGINRNKDVKIYGYIDCGVDTANLSISELQVKIQNWKDMGVTGIYCANFGFEHEVSRERQNLILDSIHQHEMSAILQADHPDEVFSDTYHETMNPEWTYPNIQSGDAYHYDSFAVDTSGVEKYSGLAETITKLDKLHTYRSNLNIRIFSTALIRSNVPEDEAQELFEYAHAVALLGSVDAFYPVLEGYGASINRNRTYDLYPIIGDWYVNDPEISTDGGIHSRETTFGKIIVDENSHTYSYDGIYIPYNVLRIAANSIDGAKLIDGTIEDKKIKSYNGGRLISSINADNTQTISISKIETFSYDDIDANGEIPIEILSANVVEAINAYIGEARIGEAVIGDLTAGKITAGTLDAARIKGSVVEALNLYAQEMIAGSAQIDQAVIGDLSAEKITAGDISAERLQATVVDAINLSAEQGNIQNLNADNIVSGNVKAERLQAEVVNAINLYTNSAVINKAKIDAAAISALTAGHIQAAVINAINTTTDSAVINSARIGELDVEHMQAAVIQAINASIEEAVIDQAKIGNLSADKITAGSIDADRLKATIIDAINLTTQTAVIDQAKISDLDASKITTGFLDADVMKGNIVDAINLYAGTATIDEGFIGNLSADKITAGDIDAERMKAAVVEAINLYAATITGEEAVIDSAAIGTLDASHMQIQVIDAINAYVGTAKIDQAKIGVLSASHIETAVIDAINANIGLAEIDGAVIGDLKAEQITSGNIATERMTANVISAVNADLTTATIDAAQISALTAGHIEAEVVQAINANIDTALISAAKIEALTAGHISAVVVEAINANIAQATIDAALIGELTAEHIQGSVIEAINARLDSAVINQAKIGVLTTEHIKGSVVEAINLNATSAKIQYGKIGELRAENIAVGEIKSDHLDANSVTTEKIAAGAVTADEILADSITSTKIRTNAVITEHMAANTIEGDRLKIGSVHGNRIEARTLSADVLEAGSITSVEIAAKAITSRNLASGSVDADILRAGIISASHISTEGLDAQSIEVYNGKTGQTLIGSGYLRIDGLDAGVVQSDNLVGNGIFMTSSSAYGYLRDNPNGEAILGNQSQIPGAHQVWKYDMTTGSVVSQIDIGGSKPVDIAIDAEDKYAYVTVQGSDKLVQVDLDYDVATGEERQMGRGPGRIVYTGDKLGDMKHFFIANTDPKDVNIPDMLTIVDGPPASVDSELYVHHNIPLGNGPYDILLSDDKITYVTMADTGDIAVINMNEHDSSTWKVIDRIPITAYMTDNYHGGLPGNVGLNYVTGGDSSSSYDTGDGGAMMAHHHGGYGTSDGTLQTFEPHGIAQSTDADTLFVADYANGHLVVVDKHGNAPYNALTGDRREGNFGTIGDDPGDIMQAHSVDNEMSIMAGGHNHGDGSSEVSVETTTRFVRYRIPVGDAPDFVQVYNGKVFVTLSGSNEVAVFDEQDIINEIEADRAYYQYWDEFTPFRPLPTFTPRKIDVGARPEYMEIAESIGRVMVTVNGQNQIVLIDPTLETIERTISTGPNPKGTAITSDGRYLYVVNHGGTGDLSFVYPKGAYIGDAYLGLEGGVEYKGAEFWVPNRSDWTYDVDGKLRSYSTVQFRVNEPFLNEGGYVKLSNVTNAEEHQFAQIEQDIVNVTNYSNGNNVAQSLGEKLKANGSYTFFYPKHPWLDDPAPTNITIASEDEDGNIVRTVADPADYTIHTGDNNYVEFIAGFITEGQWVEADYWYKNNIWHKTHNGSIAIATENSSSPNFSTLFEIDEFVPKFVMVDCLQTEDFTYEPIENPSASDGDYTGLEYSVMTNRAAGGTVSSSLPPVSGSLSSIVDEMEPVEEMDMSMMHTYGEEVAFPSGAQYVDVDLGGKYMIGKINVIHAFHKNRIYHDTKIEVSEDGSLWTTVFDSAIDGEYREWEHHMEDHMNHFGNTILFDARPVRFIRSHANGYAEYDTDWLNPVEYTENHWTEIRAFGDWELEEGYVWPNGSENEGQQIASNGKGVVTTDISRAWIAINLQIDFTSWWYMTYVSGPEFGHMDIEMPTLMGGSHSLPQVGTYINKVAHRHIMSWPPSQNIKADPSRGIVAGKHRAIIRQRSGKVSFDVFRFEDFQYLTKTSMLVPAEAPTTFRRHKIVPEQAKWYVGTGTQSTEGAYAKPRLNPDSQEPDGSVPIKYRFRVKTELNPESSIEERGIAYATSAIFEQGKLSSHWRMSQASDSFPGNRIEAWDPNQPHKTGIQSHHLAAGSVRGTKILANSIMDYHISSYAKIAEHKLGLNWDTHGHGRYEMMTHPSWGITMPMFISNKEILDSITGWGTSGTSTLLSRADHLHDERYAQLGGDNTFSGKVSASSLDLSSGTEGMTISIPNDGTVHLGLTGNAVAFNFEAGLQITGDIALSGNVDGVDIAGFKATYDAHNHNLADLAEKSYNSLTDTPASLPADGGNSDTVDGKHASDFTPIEHVGTGGASHANATATVSGFMSPSDKVKLDNISVDANKVEESSNGDILIDGVSTNVYTHPSGDGNLHVPATGTTNNQNVLKAGSTAGSLMWGQVDFSETTGELTDLQHGQRSGGLLHSLVTINNHGFMSKEDKAKFDSVEANAINQNTADSRYLKLTGGVLSDNLSISNAGDAILSLHADTDDDTGEAGAPTFILTQDDGIVGAEIGLKQGGDQNNALVLAPFMNYKTDQIKNYTVFIHDKKIWHEGNFDPSTKSDTGHRHSNATTSEDGFLSVSDKVKLDGIETEANKYIHPATHSLSMITETTGLKIMTSAERTKLSGIESGANNYIHPTTHSLSMITETTELKIMTGSERMKLSEIEPEANKYIHPATHSLDMITETSTLKIMTDVERTKLSNIEEGAINQSSADSRYLKLSGGTLTGGLTLTSGRIDSGELLTGNTQMLNTSTDTVYIGNPDTSLVLESLTSPTVNISGVLRTLWHNGNFDPGTKADLSHTHTVGEITDLATNYYSRTNIDNMLATKGDVKSGSANTFTAMNTFTRTGVALKIQPGSPLSAGQVAFQLNNSLGNNLITMGASDSGEGTGKLVINGDLEVTGTTVQKSTQDIDGDMNVTGNLSITGNSTLGDNVSDQTTVKGDLRLEGDFKPVGKYLEVGRFPVYGIGGDLQFQTDSITFEEIISQFATFDMNGGSAFPPVSDGASRHYKLMVSYSSTGVDDSTIRIVQEGTTTEIISFVLPAVSGGSGNKARTWMSGAFSTAYSGDTSFEAKKNISGTLAIRYIEVIAYDLHA